MIAGLNRKDSTILRMLSENANMPLKAIAREVRASREVVDYRIRRMEREGVISRYVAKVDMTKFCQNSYGLFVSLTNVSEASVQRIVDYLVRSPLTMWVATISGEWDIVTTFLTRNAADLNSLLMGLSNVAGKNLKDYELLTYMKEFKNTYQDLFPTREQRKKKLFMMEHFSSEPLKLDGIDKKLLLLLSNDASLTNRELSRHVRITEEAVRQRKKGLERAGVITGYRTLFNFNKLNLDMYYILLKFNKIDEKVEKELQLFFGSSPDVLYCARVVGKHDIMAGVKAESRIQFQRILAGIRNEFSYNLKDFVTNIIFEERKHTYLPEGLI